METIKNPYESSDSSDFDPDKIIREIILAWVNSLEKVVNGRKFFATAEGNFGLGPPTLRLGTLTSSNLSLFPRDP
jgi:hypothetical protein